MSLGIKGKIAVPLCCAAPLETTACKPAAGHCLSCLGPAFAPLMDEAHYFTRGRSSGASTSRLGLHSGLSRGFTEPRGSESSCCSWACRCQLLAAGPTGLCRAPAAISSRAIPRGICDHCRRVQNAETAFSKCTRRGCQWPRRPRQEAKEDGGAWSQLCATACRHTRHHGLCRSGPWLRTKTAKTDCTYRPSAC